jgi:hypothetical protein
MNLFAYKKLIFFERSTGNSLVDILDNDVLLSFLSLSEFKAGPFYRPEFENQFEKRFSKGDLAAALLNRNKIVNISWIAKDSLFINEIKKEFRIAKDEIIIYDVTTKVEDRGKGYYRLILEEINKWAMNRRYKTSIIYSDIKNLSSIKGILKAGYKKKQAITFIKIAGIKFYFNERNQE